MDYLILYWNTSTTLSPIYPILAGMVEDGITACNVPKTAQRKICFYVAFSLLSIIVIFLIFTASLFDSCALFQASRPSSPFTSSSDSIPNSHHQAILLVLDILISFFKIVLSAMLSHWNTVLCRRENRQWKSCLLIALQSNKHTY